MYVRMSNVRTYVVLTLVHSRPLGYPMENGMMAYRRYLRTKQIRQIAGQHEPFFAHFSVAGLMYT